MVALFAPDGKPLLIDRRIRQGARVLHGSPLPVTWGGVHLLSGNRAFFQVMDWVGNDTAFEKWAYDLSTGTRIDLELPKPPRTSEHLGLVETLPLTGTPLSVVHWSHHPGNQGHAVFAMINDAQRILWHLTVTNELTRIKDSDLQNQTRKARADGSLRSGTNLGQFDILLYKSRRRIRLLAATDKRGWWKITRRDESPFDWQQHRPSPKPSVPLLNLPIADEIDLAPTIPALKHPGWIHMGGDDRINIVDTKSLEIFTLDRSGREVGRDVVQKTVGDDLEAIMAWEVLQLAYMEHGPLKIGH
ncbi:MAG: hypothetical protein ACPGVU_02430 [Limisphaerales bacterium]